MVDLYANNQMGFPMSEERDQSHIRLNGCSATHSQRRQGTTGEGGHIRSSVIDYEFEHGDEYKTNGLPSTCP